MLVSGGRGVIALFSVREVWNRRGKKSLHDELPMIGWNTRTIWAVIMRVKKAVGTVLPPLPMYISLPRVFSQIFRVKKNPNLNEWLFNNYGALQEWGQVLRCGTGRYLKLKMSTSVLCNRIYIQVLTLITFYSRFFTWLLQKVDRTYVLRLFAKYVTLSILLLSVTHVQHRSLSPNYVTLLWNASPTKISFCDEVWMENRLFVSIFKIHFLKIYFFYCEVMDKLLLIIICFKTVENWN